MTDIIVTSPQITEVIVSNFAPYGNGPTGPQGATGVQGATGPQGATGAQGATGPQGAAGAQGATGPQGNTGATGAQGATGVQGPTGVQGATGIQGATGPIGQTGPVGQTGPQGATGVQGATGPQGAAGLTGATGPIGETGPQGATGVVGPSGATGPIGQTGPQGPTGVQGATGPQGQTGPQGTTGPTGATGVAGDRYSTTSSTSLTIATGSQTLTIETGLAYTINQDVLIVYNTGSEMSGNITSYNSGTGELIVDVVSILGSGTYSSWLVNLAGAAGGPGATGVQGPTGASGPTGPQGVTGPTGPVGQTGPIGITGATGPIGETGPIGQTGPQGATGVQGPIGETGPIGPSGSIGPQGATGPVGETGPIGPSGSIGPVGATGPQGATGPLPIGYATTGSNTFIGNQIISGSLTVTSSLTASGLIYPTTDGLEGQVLETNGAGVLSFGDVETMYEQIYTGENITKGDPLYISGSQGATPIVYKADAAIASKMPVIYIASETIAAGNTSRGIVLGLISGINLTGYVAGDDVYVAAGGGWTGTRPTGSAIVQVLGYVTQGGAGGKGLVLNPGPVDLPNIPQNNLWIGNASGVPVTQSKSVFLQGTFSSSAQVVASQTEGIGAYATTGSNTFYGNQTINGDIIPGTGNAILMGTDGYIETPNIRPLPAGPNANILQIGTTGSVTDLIAHANTIISGTLVVTGSITGNLTGNASTATTASFAENANLLDGLNSTAFATTGSNTFVNDQTISGSSILYAGTIINNGNGLVLNGGMNVVRINGAATQIGNSTQITGSLNVSAGITGSLSGTASFANETNWSGIRSIPSGIYSSSAQLPAGLYSSSAQLPAGIISSSAQLPAGTVSSSAQITSLTNVTISGSTIISGSTAGNIVALSIASNTASLNASAGSFYTLLLVSGSTTRVEPTAIGAGRTFSLRIKQASVASGSVVFSSTFKFPTGSAYTATSTANAEDILSFITFDTGSIYAVATKQLV